jgi:hypothetical protein
MLPESTVSYFYGYDVRDSATSNSDVYIRSSWCTQGIWLCSNLNLLRFLSTSDEIELSGLKTVLMSTFLIFVIQFHDIPKEP